MKGPVSTTAAIHELSGFGRASLMVIIRILSTMGIQVSSASGGAVRYFGDLGEFRLRSVPQRGDYWGTVASLPTSWTSGDQDIGVWDVGVRTCDELLIRVWCVQDDSVWRVFMPIFTRS